MEFLTDSLKETVSKLSENQKEEIDVVESIININETNKEKTKEKISYFIKKRKPENAINFILGCMNYTAQIKPKERESLLFLLTSVFADFKLNLKILENFNTLKNMLQVKKLPSDKETDEYIFLLKRKQLEEQ